MTPKRDPILGTQMFLFWPRALFVVTLLQECLRAPATVSTQHPSGAGKLWHRLFSAVAIDEVVEGAHVSARTAQQEAMILASCL